MRVKRIAWVTVLAAGAAAAACGDQELVCGKGSDSGPLYPLQEGAWWRDRVTTENDVGQTEEVDKVVYSCAPQQMPLRPDITAYPVVSMKEPGYGLRWQGTNGDGDGDGAVRYCDEWFDADGTRTEVTFYCPSRIRVPDLDLFADGNTHHDEWWEATLTLDEANPGSWDDCVAAEIDMETCAAIDLPAGCALSAAEQKWQDFTLEETDEQIAVPAGTFSAIRLNTVDSDGEISTFWWARGRGKVAEETPTASESEQLVDYCLPGGDATFTPPVNPEMPAFCP